MFAASYVGTRDGFMGMGNRIIRLRLVEAGHKWEEFFRNLPEPGSNVLRASHTELFFEPEDDVAEFMPDKSCQRDHNGALWAFSSTGTERVHATSKRRAGHIGGARFKRINPFNERWVHQPINKFPARLAAERCVESSGQLYDWQNIMSFASWLIPHKNDREMCCEKVLNILGVRDAYRFDPCSAMVIFESFK